MTVSSPLQPPIQPPPIQQPAPPSMPPSIQPPPYTDSDSSVPGRIVEAAVQLVHRDGMRGLSQARVAAAAGLRQSHLTYYFPTRQALIQGVVQALYAEMVRTIGAVMESTAAQEDTLGAVRAFFSDIVRKPVMGRLMVALMYAADESPPMRQWLGEFDQEALRVLGQVFARLGKEATEDELAWFHATLSGCVLRSAHTDSLAVRDETLRVVQLALDRIVAGCPCVPRSPPPCVVDSAL